MLICLEGINGAGKSTLAHALAACWTTVCGGAAVHAEPVQHTDYGVKIRKAIMETGDLQSEAEALAFASARLHAAAALNSLAYSGLEHLVIVERWAGAVVAYGAAAGADPALVLDLERLLGSALRIERTFLVDTPGRVAASRLDREADPNRFETQGAAYLENVRQGYLAWARERDIGIVSGLHERPDEWAASVVAEFARPAAIASTAAGEAHDAAPN